MSFSSASRASGIIVLIISIRSSSPNSRHPEIINFRFNAFWDVSIILSSVTWTNCLFISPNNSWYSFTNSSQKSQLRRFNISWIEILYKLIFSTFMNWEIKKIKKCN